MPIKMTKELPTEEGWYYFSSEVGETPLIGEIDGQGDFYCDDKYIAASSLGGYWAKVDKDQFEFEG